MKYLVTLLALLFTATAAVASPAITVTAAFSSMPPFAANQATNLTFTFTNTLPPSSAAVSLALSTSFNLLSTGAQTSTATDTLVAGTSDLASSIVTTTTLPTALLTVGALPSGVTYNSTTGVLVITLASAMDGGGSETVTIPVTFRSAI